jgi:hypothetical protein
LNSDFIRGVVIVGTRQWCGTRGQYTSN